MKKTNYIYLIIIMLVAGLGCKKEKHGNSALTPVQQLDQPADGDTIVLDPATNPTVTFQWEEGAAVDGGLVQYEIGFDKEGGDFSHPLFKITADGNGIQNKATVSHKDLNMIARLAGKKGLEYASLNWTVFAVRGTNVQKAAATKKLTVRRGPEIQKMPSSLYLTGAATEGGEDLSKAIPFKSTGDGSYELYTSLKPGNWKLVDKSGGTPYYYYVSGISIGEGDQGATQSDTKTYRIRLDFNNAAAEISEIKAVAFWFGMDWNTAFGDPTPAGDKANVKYMLDYVGNSTWKASNKYIEMQNPGWGLEGRYKFRLTVNKGSGDQYEFWGSKNSDNPDPSSSTPAEYWFLYPVSDSQWDYSFKLQSAVQKKNNDIIVYFQPDKEYRTEIIPK